MDDTCSEVERSLAENLFNISVSDFSYEIDTSRDSEYEKIAYTGQVKKEQHKFNQSSDIEDTEILKRRFKIDILCGLLHTLKIEVKSISAHKGKAKHRNKLAFESGCDMEMHG